MHPIGLIRTWICWYKGWYKAEAAEATEAMEATEAEVMEAMAEAVVAKVVKVVTVVKEVKAVKEVKVRRDGGEDLERCRRNAFERHRGNRG